MRKKTLKATFTSYIKAWRCYRRDQLLNKGKKKKPECRTRLWTTRTNVGKSKISLSVDFQRFDELQSIRVKYIKSVWKWGNIGVSSPQQGIIKIN